MTQLHRWLPTLCAGLLLGCGSSAPSASVNDAPSGLREAIVSIRTLAEAFKTQAVVRRWRASDVHHFEVVLRELRAGAPVLSRVELPREGGGEARFSRLRHGERYLVEVRAWGDPGGETGTTLLSANATASFDFAGDQDVEDRVQVPVNVLLDPVPFAGTLTLHPTNIPASALRFEVQLYAQGAQPLLSQIYERSLLGGNDFAIANLAAGVPYRVVVSAQDLELVSQGGELVTRWRELERFERGEIRFDPGEDDLESQRMLDVAF